MARILVMDDQEDMRAHVEHALRAAGHEVMAAGHGLEGWEKFEKEPVDLVVTDIYMPEMEGLEFIFKFRRKNPQVPIIAMSGNPDLTIALDIAKKFGAIITLSKPFSRMEIQMAVEQALTAAKLGITSDE